VVVALGEPVSVRAEPPPTSGVGPPADPGYTLYHPRWYRRRVSVWWWLQNRSYARFVLRELTSVAVAYFALVTLWLIRAVARGPEAYADALARLASPLFVILNLIGFALVLYHAITWFNLAPVAMVLRVRGKRVPDAAIAGANYAAWIVLSAFVIWIFLGVLS
jgi:fumarate reductase subunit C